MDGYKHYIRTDVNGIVIKGFTDGFLKEANGSEEILPGDLLLTGYDQRQFQLPLTNDRLQFIYKLVNGAMVARNQTELDAEWNSRPPEPKPDSELLKEARQEIGRLNRSMDSLSADVQAIIDTIVV